MLTVQNVNPQKLTDELINAGITVLLATNNLQDGDYVAEETAFKFAEETDMNLVQQIIDAHDPTPIQTVSSDEILKAKIETETINLLIDLGVI